MPQRGGGGGAGGSTGRGRGRGGRSSSSSRRPNETKNGGGLPTGGGRSSKGSNGGGRGMPSSPSDPYSPGPSTFASSFPAPQRPRRHPPTVHRDSYIGTSSANDRTNGVVFRNADSTQRALSELAKRRYERMERRRAGGLLVGLLCLAVCVHLMNAGEGDVVPSAVAGGGGGAGRSGLRSARYAAGGEIDYGGTVAEDFDVVGSDGNDRDGDDNGGEKLSKEEAAKRAREKTEAAALAEKERETAKKKRLEEEREAALPDAEELEIEEGKEFLEPIRHFAEVSSVRRKTDVPFFFHVPRSGGQTMKDIVGKCLKLTLASEVGVRDGHGQDPELKVVNIKDGNYVNVDTTSLDGIARASSMNLAPSGLAHLVSSSYFSDAGALFDLQHQGRAFTILRNPVERAVSMYYYRLAEETLDSSVTMEEYAQGNGIENNWMTRYLVNAMEGELTKEHLNNAKEVLERKFLVGFLDDGEETMHRLMKYFGWEYDEDETKQMNQEDCIKDLLTDGTNVNVEGYEMPKKGTQAYALLTWQTQFDMKLYDHAKELFDAQTKHWGTKERKKLLKKQKKKAHGK